MSRLKTAFGAVLAMNWLLIAHGEFGDRGFWHFALSYALAIACAHYAITAASEKENR